MLGEGPAFVEMAVGDVALEVFACWALVLAVSGLYLWWPRKRGTGRAMFVPRLRKSGRARWRDLHAIPGVVLSGLLVFFVRLGSAVVGVLGSELGRGRHSSDPERRELLRARGADARESPKSATWTGSATGIPWATRSEDIPTSSGGGSSMPGMDMEGDTATSAEGTGDDIGAGLAGSDLPAPASLDLIVEAAEQEGMLRGASVTLPFNDSSDPTSPVLGSYVVTNPWPSDISNQGALFLDQFTGETLDRSFASEWGELQWVTELGVQTHMGTEFGLASRVVMTVACLLVVWAAVSGLVMFWKRRRGGTGFPRRPLDARLQRGMIVIAVLLALVYPLWGVSVVAVLLFDTYVIRRVPPLRRAFGMKDPEPEPVPVEQ